MFRFRALLGGLLLALALGMVLPGAALALTPGQAARIAAGDTDDRLAALNEAVLAADPALGPYLQALLADEVRVAGGRAYVVRGEQVLDAATGAAATLPEGAEDVINNNRMRRELQAARAALQLFSPVRAERAQAIVALRGEAGEGMLALIEKAEAAETDDALEDELAILKAAVQIASPDKARRLAAATLLAASGTPATQALLIERLGPGGEDDAEVRAALQRSLNQVQSRLAWGERLGVLFSGISLGSILLLVALGLAITYGLMGVIN
ncbi:MAG TPA: urea ABC transporter permease subunit UrtB, partial [Rubrivivax sp.]|nr:urea ABC transporter permease subunit UrtB [Rubrivivax sp.]